jgi:hypothetical protein
MKPTGAARRILEKQKGVIAVEGGVTEGYPLRPKGIRVCVRVKVKG